ncbi:hypothetical protein BYT27DRAFT_6672204 [Phlegmacium glaucopus]|nr:hypothetical protein BYT27DRAFT_6672204 [Phlegmacium glaucopus]
MFRPLTRSLSRRSNEQSFGFPVEIMSNHTSMDLGTHSRQLLPRSRPSRDFARPRDYSNRENDYDIKPYDAAHYYRTATHMDLLQAGNTAYGSLYEKFMGIQGRYEELCVSYDKLTNTVKTAMDSSGPASLAARPSSTLAFQALKSKFKHEDFPQIKFITQRNYHQFQKKKMKDSTVLDPALGQKKRGSTRLASNNENVATDYIEYEDGTIVMGDTAKSVRSHARAVLIEMDNHGNMQLPSSWSLAGVTERKYFIQEMYHAFPYLSLCDDDWKVLYLASRALSAFHEFRRRQAKKTPIIKSEVKSETVKIKVEPKSNYGAGLRPTNTNDDDDDDIYMPYSTPPSRNAKRKAPSSTPTTQRPSKQPRNSTHIVYDLTCNSDEEITKSPPTTTISPTSSPSSSSPALSEPPTSSTPTNLTTLPSPKSATPSVAPRPKPRAKSSHQQVTTTTITKTHAQDHPHTGPAETVVTMASNDLQMANAAPESAEACVEDPSYTGTAGMAGAVEAPTTVPAISVENPFASLFGPAIGPSGRLESLGETSKGIVKEARVSTAKEASNATEKVYTESESIARAKTFGPGTKRVTTSSSAKNLYYIEYLQLNEPITPAAFEAHWSGLTKDTVKKYMLLSKSQK